MTPVAPGGEQDGVCDGVRRSDLLAEERPRTVHVGRVVCLVVVAFAGTVAVAFVVAFA